MKSNHLDKDIKNLQQTSKSADNISYNLKKLYSGTIVHEIDFQYKPPSSSQYCKGIYKIRLQYDTLQQYPNYWPLWIGFRSNINHIHVGGDGLIDSNVLLQFYDKQELLCYDLQNILKVIDMIMQRPIHPCHNCNLYFEQMFHREMHHQSVIEKYKEKRLHKELFEQWNTKWFHPTFLELVQLFQNSSSSSSSTIIQEALEKKLLREESPTVYSFHMMRDQFCDLLIQEYEHFQSTGLPVQRPNSMNQYGLILNSIGWEDMVSTLQQDYIQPISAKLFPLEGAALDQHHTFLVQYQHGKDLGLDMHTDDSDVTLNLCLGKQFTGACLTFCGNMGSSNHRHFQMGYQHQKGRAIIHLGRQRHGADDILSGERINLIIWNRSFSWRLADLSRVRHEPEASKPDQVCLSYTHDRDYSAFFPNGTKGNENKGWCPVKGMEYPEFRSIMSKRKCT